MSTFVESGTAQRYAQVLARQGLESAGLALYGQVDTIEAIPRYTSIEVRWLSHLMSGPFPDRERRVMDTGCGNGYAYPLLQTLAFETGRPTIVYYVDKQPEMLDKLDLQIRNPKLQPWQEAVLVEHDFVIGWKKQQGVFHGIFSRYLLQWLSNAEEYLQDMSCALEPGGFLYLDTLTPYNRALIFSLAQELMPERLTEVNQQMEESSVATMEHFSSGQKVSGFTSTYFHETLPKLQLEILEMETYKNPHWPNGLGDEYPENIRLIAKKK